MRYLQQGGDKCVAAGLLDNTLARVHQDQRDVGSRCPGHHIPRVLYVPGCVGDDKLPSRCRKIPVGDIYGNALLALGLQPIRQKGQVDLFLTLAITHRLHVAELVFKNRFAVIQKATDECALTIIHRSGRCKS